MTFRILIETNEPGVGARILNKGWVWLPKFYRIERKRLPAGKQHPIPPGPTQRVHHGLDLLLVVECSELVQPRPDEASTALFGRAGLEGKPSDDFVLFV